MNSARCLGRDGAGRAEARRFALGRLVAEATQAERGRQVAR